MSYAREFHILGITTEKMLSHIPAKYSMLQKREGCRPHHGADSYGGGSLSILAQTM